MSGLDRGDAISETAGGEGSARSMTRLTESGQGHELDEQQTAAARARRGEARRVEARPGEARRGRARRGQARRGRMMTTSARGDDNGDAVNRFSPNAKNFAAKRQRKMPNKSPGQFNGKIAEQQFLLTNDRHPKSAKNCYNAQPKFSLYVCLFLAFL